MGNVQYPVAPGRTKRKLSILAADREAACLPNKTICMYREIRWQRCGSLAGVLACTNAQSAKAEDNVV